MLKTLNQECIGRFIEYISTLGDIMWLLDDHIFSLQVSLVAILPLLFIQSEKLNTPVKASVCVTLHVHTGTHTTQYVLY